MANTIDDVRSFWDANPLLSGELEEPMGSEAWFRKLDAIKTTHVFGGDLSHWIPRDVEGKRVLDVGCGPGYWNRLLAGRQVEYHGIDISSVTIQLALRSQEIFRCGGCLAVGNAESLDFPAGYFDLVLSEGVIHHTPNTQACVEEIYRVLRSGGNARVGVYYKNLILRSSLLFGFSQWLLRLFNVYLKGRGREQMLSAASAEDFVRMYDGKDNPIGKAYTQHELRQLFGKFSKVSFQRYYFPLRAIGVNLPKPLIRLLNSTFGLMILVKAEK